MSDQQLDTSGSVFRCNNLSLAIALTAFGCAFPSEGNRTLMGFNQYSPGFVKGQKDERFQKSPAIRRGLEEIIHLADAIKYLWRMGIPGNVCYFFIRSPLLTAIIKGWNEQGEQDPAKPTELKAEDVECGKIARRLMQTKADYIGDKGLTPIWRRKDSEGNLFVPAIKHIEGSISSEPYGEKGTRTIIREAKAHAVAV